MHGRYLLYFSNNPSFSDQIYFQNNKITDEKLRSVSIYNNLVASSNIQNRCREVALNTGPYADGKTRQCVLRLKASGRDSEVQAVSTTQNDLHPSCLYLIQMGERKYPSTFLIA